VCDALSLQGSQRSMGEALTSLSLEKGYEVVTIRDITGRAGRSGSRYREKDDALPRGEGVGQLSELIASTRSVSAGSGNSTSQLETKRPPRNEVNVPVESPLAGSAAESALVRIR